MIKITTDSTSDLPKELANKYNISIFPLIVTLGENEFLDGIDIDQDKIFNYVKETNTLPKTSARNIADYITFFEENLKDADSIIHISLGGELSSSLRNAMLAGDEIGVDKVHIIDSKALSSVIGLLAVEGAKKAQNGDSVETVIKYLEELVEKAQTSFVVDKLDYLYKGGRCSKFSFSIGGMLKIKPRLQMLDGKMVNTGKEIGPLKVVLKKYIDSMLDKYPNVIKDYCCLTHTKMSEELIKELKEHLENKHIFDKIYVVEAGSVITSHCGENTLGLLYLCK